MWLNLYRKDHWPPTLDLLLCDSHFLRQHPQLLIIVIITNSTLLLKAKSANMMKKKEGRKKKKELLHRIRRPLPLVSQLVFCVPRSRTKVGIFSCTEVGHGGANFRLHRFSFLNFLFIRLVQVANMIYSSDF